MAFKRLYITLPPDTLEKLEKTAKEKGRSKSNMIAYLIEQYK
jgi:Ribbon-helix-helix protein, copG family.